MNEGLTAEEREWLVGAVRRFSSDLGRDDNLDAILEGCKSHRDRIKEISQWRRRAEQANRRLHRLKLALEDLLNAPAHEQRRLFNRLCRRHLGGHACSPSATGRR